MVTLTELSLQEIGGWLFSLLPSGLLALLMLRGALADMYTLKGVS